MFCKHCGNILPENAKFCTSCGAPVENATVERNTAWNSGYETVHSAEPVPQVGFVEAIKLFFSKYADFSGRARRSEYWWVVFFNILVGTLLRQIAGDDSFVPAIWNLAVLIPSIAISVRRLHDVGKRGTYYLWNLLPIVGQIMMLIQVTKDSAPANEFGPSPKYK